MPNVKRVLFHLLARLLSWAFPAQRRERFLSWLEAEEARQAALPSPSPSKLLPWDVGGETGEFRPIFKLSADRVLSVAQVRRLDGGGLDNEPDWQYITPS